MTDFMKQMEKELADDRELAKLTRQEELILDLTELILKEMDREGVSKSQLANMLNRNKSHVTQLLRGSRNMTLRTVSDIFFELGCKVIIDAIADRECCTGLAHAEWEGFVDREPRTAWNLYEQQEVTQSTKSDEERMVA